MTTVTCDDGQFLLETPGKCPICEQKVTFIAHNPWLRDYLICMSCYGGSVPRERALMLVIKRLFPNWKELSIHESSPGSAGASAVLSRDCVSYVGTQFFAEVQGGSLVDGTRCENLEATTFPDNSLDLIVTQDVLEHVNYPDRVFRDCFRTLKQGGAHVFTVPTYKHLVNTQRKALYTSEGIEYLSEPEYHLNPVSAEGSLVTFHYGYDLPEKIREWSGLDVEVFRFCDAYHGLLGEHLETYVAWKR